MTTVATREQSKEVLETIRDSLSGDSIRQVFQSMDLPIDAVQVEKVFIQDSAEPYTCYNNRLDGDETDVDCGGSSCLSRCASAQQCKVNGDCSKDASCFNNKCSGFSGAGRAGSRVDWTRVFYIACISVGVIVVIVVVSVVVSVIRKKNVGMRTRRNG